MFFQHYCEHYCEHVNAVYFRCAQILSFPYPGDRHEAKTAAAPGLKKVRQRLAAAQARNAVLPMPRDTRAIYLYRSGVGGAPAVYFILLSIYCK